MNILISSLSGLPVAAGPVEMVERKGLGHPDTICDYLAENLSRNLCRFYHDRFGIVLHHNVDKGLLFGGRSAPAFGGGKVLEPMDIFLVGRATMSFRGIKVPVEELAIEGTRQWFRENFHALDPERHLNIHCLIRPGSQDLTELFLRQATTGIALANDTSCGVGYAPFSELETVVLESERYLNSPVIRDAHPAFGQDIKVMGLRNDDHIVLTVACAFIDKYVRDLEDYLQQKKMLAGLVHEHAAKLTQQEIAVHVNTGDDPAADSVYLTVTGTSGEAGDDGEVGRGNRPNGLITPYRPMNMEAAAGKNPVTHVGKIYNVAARRMAEQIVQNIPAVEEAYCFLVSQIGYPVQEPQRLEIKLRVADERVLPQLQGEVSLIAENSLQEMSNLWRQVIKGTVPVC
ncbi:MAG: methionine adenosyltransferase [Proteobacteria bacterium]|nr:methionine adenosyltransferase [Pseudomonadota bacterium]MBU1649290.1 methionine adenosyltransferase [Pseudomonadota bacterium]MBU1986736.1 methionine adenosyltransferase [Pseudomonadota bacterium]